MKTADSLAAELVGKADDNIDTGDGNDTISSGNGGDIIKAGKGTNYIFGGGNTGDLPIAEKAVGEADI